MFKVTVQCGSAAPLVNGLPDALTPRLKIGMVPAWTQPMSMRIIPNTGIKFAQRQIIMTTSFRSDRESVYS